MAGGALVERDGELEWIAARLDAASAGRGGLIYIEGPAGIGKTALVTAATGRAKRCGFRVLTARGGELERGFPHGIVRQLLETTVVRAGKAERDALLAGAARLAGPTLGVGEPIHEPDEHTVLHGLFWLCMNLADGDPLLLAVDDAHWADPPSLRFAAYLARRLPDAPVLLVLAARPAETDEDQMLLEAVAAASPESKIRPAALTPDGTCTLLGRRFATVGVEFAGACHQATGGNPFLLGELVGALESENCGTEAADAERVRRVGPPSVSAAVRRRIDRLPAAAAGLARAVAVLGSAVQLRQAAVLAELDAAVAARCADALRAADILAPERQLDFVHPIVRRVVYDAIPAGEVALAHGRAAAVLSADGVDAESVAAHLLVAEPRADTEVVALLRVAAARSVARGAPDAAAAYLRRALVEPVPPSLQAVVSRELGRAEISAGEPGGVNHLRAALAATEVAADRAQVARELAFGLVAPGRYPEAIDALEHALVAVPDDDPGLALQLTAELATVGRLHPSTRDFSVRYGDRLPDDLPGVTPAQCAALASLALHRLLSGAPASEVAGLATRALAGGLIAQRTAEHHLVYDALAALWATEAVDVAVRAHDATLADATRRGSVLGFARASAFRAQLRYRLGELREAESDARASLDAADPGWPVTWIALAALIDVLVERDRLTEAAAQLRDRGGDGEIAHTFMADFLLHARGRLRIAQRRFTEGVEDLREFARRGQAWPGRSPALFPYRAQLAAALLVQGEPGAALRMATEDVEAARRWDTRGAVGSALRGLGLVTGGAAGLALLQDAVTELEPSPARLEHARALADLGAALRRAGRRAPARPVLAAALDLATRCGADALAARARSELVTAGARPRRDRRTGPAALTAAELRVARMAAGAMTNREIAQSLFVTLRAVELHLTHAYRKLGISARDQLATALQPEACGVQERVRLTP